MNNKWVILIAAVVIGFFLWRKFGSSIQAKLAG